MRMGLFSFLKNQFIEVIEWTDTSERLLVYRFPVQNNEIKMGAQLTVRESQSAIFVNQGQIADVFGPGRYTLTTENMPVLTALKSWKHGFNSPFKAEVYFVNRMQFTNQKWGTTNPILMRDQEFGMIRLRGYGNYSFRVSDPKKFLQELFGTKASFSTEEISGQFKTTIVSGLSDLIGESQIAAVDLALHYDELSEQARTRLQTGFDVYGLQLTSLIIENLSLPEDVEKAIDRKSSMNIAGNLSAYTQFQAAEAMRDAANNPSGDAGTGIGLGAGIAMGQMLQHSINAGQQATTPSQASTPSSNIAPSGNSSPCSNCKSPLQPSHKFCPQCGTPNAVPKFCTGCGKPLEPSAKFCGECGTKSE